MNVVLNRTVVVGIDWRFNNLCQNELYHVSWWYYNSGYRSDRSIRLLLWVVRQLSRDVTLIGSFPLKLFSFVLDVFETGHSTSYWGKFDPLDPLDGQWYAWWNLSKWCFSVGIIDWPVDEDEIFKPRDWRLSCLSAHGGWGDRWMTFQTAWWVGLTYFLSQFTYKISDTIELKSSIFSLVIVFRAGWSFPSTTGSAKEWKR